MPFLRPKTYNSFEKNLKLDRSYKISSSGVTQSKLWNDEALRMTLERWENIAPKSALLNMYAYREGDLISVWRDFIKDNPDISQERGLIWDPETLSQAYEYLIDSGLLIPSERD